MLCLRKTCFLHGLNNQFDIFRAYLKVFEKSVLRTSFNFSVPITKKHSENCEKLHREPLIGCQGVKLFLLKYVTITTVTTATVTTVNCITVTI